MADTIRSLKEQYGSNSPAVAKQLNSIGVELKSRGHPHTALKFHQEALTILEWNKCSALLYDFVDKSKEYAIDMALTLRKIGNLLQETNNFVGAAEVYKECLDTFLEGLIEGGGALKRRLLQCEYKKHSDSYQAILDQVDRKTIGRILCLHPEFRGVVRDISRLFEDMQLIKFVGMNAASSRGRRRKNQHAKREENLKHAIESLSMPDGSEIKVNTSRKKEMKSPRRQMSRSHSWSSTTSARSDGETTWIKSFWEKEMGRFSRPRPLSQRKISADEEYGDYGRYSKLSSLLVPAEEMLVTALNRFPLPRSVVGGDSILIHRGIDSAPSQDSLRESFNAEGFYTEKDLEERDIPPPPPHHIAGTLAGTYSPPHSPRQRHCPNTSSPRCVTHNIFQETLEKTLPAMP